MRRVRLGPAADLAEGSSRGFELGERHLLVSRRGGRFYGISDRCNHAGCLLSKGTFDETSVTCPCHGVAFDVRTGENLNAPHLCGDQDAYPLCVEGGWLVAEVDDDEGGEGHG